MAERSIYFKAACVTGNSWGQVDEVDSSHEQFVMPVTGDTIAGPFVGEALKMDPEKAAEILEGWDTTLHLQEITASPPDTIGVRGMASAMICALSDPTFEERFPDAMRNLNLMPKGRIPGLLRYTVASIQREEIELQGTPVQ